MGSRNFVEEFEYGDTKGLDTTSPLSMVGPGYVREARNANLGSTGGYMKREGVTEVLTTPWDSLSIRQGFQYVSSTGTNEKLFYGTDDVSVGKFGKEAAGAITDIVTGLDAQNRLFFVQFQDRLFAFNGDSVNAPFLYEGGLVTRELGIAPPLAAPVATAGTSGTGELELGLYVFSYTYAIRSTVTGQILAESSPSEPAIVELTGTQNKVALDVVASTATVSGSLEIIIRVFRTVVNGSVLFLETELANLTVTYQSETPDAGLGDTQIENDNTQLKEFEGYTKARFPVVARNRIFVMHENRNEGRFSKIGQEGPLPESFQATAIFSLEGASGAADTVVGAGQIKGIPIILKQRSIGRLEETGLPDFGQASDLVTYTYRELSGSVGAVNHSAQAQVLDELVFLGRDNIYATDGQNVRPIGTPIQSTIKALDFRNTKNYNISAGTDTKNKRVYISIFESTTATEPNFVLVGDYQQYPEFRWTFYEEGDDNVTHPGIRSGSFFQIVNTSDGSYDMYFGNTDGNGQYYRMNDGDSDINYTTGDPLGIFFRITTRPYSFSQPLVSKLFQRTKVFAEAADNTYELTICSITDLNSEEDSCSSFEIVGTGNNWDEHNWVDNAETEADPLIWAGPSLAELIYCPHRKAKFMQLVFKQTDAEAPVTLLGWGLSGSIFTGV